MGHKRKKVCGLDPEFGAIFMSNTQTKEECLKKQLFGLPSTHCEFVRKVKVGMVLFLFEYETRKLHGIFEAVSDGEVNIVPSAYRYCTGKSFPAQVRVRRIMHCQPLSEYEFSGVIKDNYYSLNKFNFGLSEHQVQDLFLLFKSRSVGESFKDSREKNVRRQGAVSSRKVQRHQSDDDTYYEKIIVPPQDVVSQVSGECVLSPSSTSRSSKKQLWASSQSNQIQEKYQTTDSIMCCENETPQTDDGYPPDDDLGDFIPLAESSDEEEEINPGDGTEYANNGLLYGGGNEYLSSLHSTRSRPSFGGGGESSQLIGTTNQRFGDKEESQIVGGSVATQLYNNNNKVSSNAAEIIICHDDSNSSCTTASSKNVLMCNNNVQGGLYCDAAPPKRTSVFSRLNWRTMPQDNEIRARADKYVDEITQELLQNKYDLGGGIMLQQLKRQKCTAAAAELVNEEEQVILHPNPNPDHQGGSSVFRRLGERVGGSRLETL